MDILSDRIKMSTRLKRRIQYTTETKPLPGGRCGVFSDSRDKRELAVVAFPEDEQIGSDDHEDKGRDVYMANFWYRWLCVVRY